MRTSESTSEWSRELALLRRAGVALEPGLSEAELRAAERRVGVPFPPDLRALLATAMPAGGRFPNWRAPDAPKIAEQLAWPLEGMRFDIEHNTFWWPAWGPRPAALADAFEVARARVAEAPALIPLYGHRYLPAEPCEAGNPVLSVYQTDIIYYGTNLHSYFALELDPLVHYASLPWDDVRPVRFWSEVIEWNGTGDTGDTGSTTR
ncbi:MAG TPA: hypothetical protein VKA84_01515 [Gemmatimonadaceae bacterium]|nr:hypothetical protein [Gemmatimonadaceae bacterium]